MKKIILGIALFLSMLVTVRPANAQDCESTYYPITKGAVVEMQSFNAKDKLEGTTRTSIVDVAREGGKITIFVSSESFDKKGKPIASQDLEMECKDGVFSMDMKNFLDPNTLSSSEGMEVQVDASNLETPGNLSAGQSLKDGSINISMSANGIRVMNMEVRITDRKVEGTEKVTTPAGTFDCYKITYKLKVKSMISSEQKQVQYIAHGIGAVRTESYDKKGNLNSYTVLSSISGM